MNITDRARATIIDIALRRGVDKPLVRIAINYPSPGVRLISTNFINDYNINTQTDVVDNAHIGIVLVYDQTSQQVLSDAMLDVNRGNQFFVKWKKEETHDLYKESSGQDSRDRGSREHRESNHQDQNRRRRMRRLPIRNVISGTGGDI